MVEFNWTTFRAPPVVLQHTRALNSCTAFHAFFNKYGPLLDNITNYTASTLAAYEMTQSEWPFFDVSGRKSPRKQKRKNKTWRWTRPLKEKRKKSPHRLLKRSPSWEPLQGSSRRSLLITDPRLLRRQKQTCYQSQKATGKKQTFYIVNWTQDKSPAALIT